jgi:GNAT superfamily N-acetyltransferase
MRTRAATSDDIGFLRAMGYEAAIWRADAPRPPLDEVLAQPHLARYLDGWGRPGDAGVIALDRGGRPLGAAWYRLFPAAAPGYGFVAPDVPELAIGVAADARGAGVGGALLAALKAAARSGGFGHLSLSVDRRNPALRLYERHGFRDAGVSTATATSVTMVADLAAPGAGEDTPPRPARP